MSDRLQFRLAVESDAELLLDFMQAYYALDGHSYDRDRARGALIPLLKNQNFGRAWIILNEDSPVGYAVLCLGYSLEWLGRDAFVDELYLVAEYRGRGWGRRTLAFLEHAARELGIRALHLAVVKGNRTALQLYESSGFRRHDSTFLSKWIASDFSKPSSAARAIPIARHK